MVISQSISSALIAQSSFPTTAPQAHQRKTKEMVDFGSKQECHVAFSLVSG
jgi:hypothetical protein